MFDPVAQLLAYLRPPPGALWRWTEEGSVIVWSDDVTILFREELKQILTHLSATGWPPCSALVLLLAATRGKAPALHESLTLLSHELKTDLIATAKDAPPEAQHLKRALNRKVEETLDLLVAVSKLPPELLKTPQQKAVLVQMVFEHQEMAIPADDTRRLLHVFDSSPQNFHTLPDGNDTARKEPLLHDIHLLREGLKRISAERLATRLQTGLDALPDAAELELPPAKRMAALIAQLEQDEEMGSLAHLVREVAASLYLPRAFDQRDEMALGGVSDITNRGTLDRLLLSELAHDDLTLAVRVALNEALYLRREPPATQPPGRLLILLDAGVRMWGIPRILGTAAAMAFTLRRTHHREAVCWRAQNDALAESELLTRSGLSNHLQHLEISAHPGAAVAAFFREYEAQEHSEAIIVTHLDALQDEEFLTALGNFPAPCWVAGVERDGRFAVYQHPGGWIHPLCSAEIDLERLLKEPVRPDLRRKAAGDLPLYFSLHPSPLRCPVTGEVNYWAVSGSKVVCIAGRRLYRWEMTNQGAELLSANVPRGRILWFHERADGAFYVLTDSIKQGSIPLALIPTNGDPEETIRLPVDYPPDEVCYQNGQLLFFYSAHVDVFNPATGAKTSSLTFGPTMQWVSSRYCRTKDGWLYLDWDGSKLVAYPLHLPSVLRDKNIVAMFDRPGTTEGPWALTSSGEIYFTGNGGGRHMMFQLHGVTLNKYKVSRDGNQLLVGHSAHQVLVRLDNRQTALLRGRQRHILDPLPAMPTANVRNRLAAIHANSHGRILLKTRKGNWLETDFSLHQVIRLTRLTTGPDQFVDFMEITSDNHDYSLQRADFPNGSKAWLDSRGYLHLTGNTANSPELCLVLHDAHISVWSSDGDICGQPFFIANQKAVPAAQQYRKIMDWARQAAC